MKKSRKVLSFLTAAMMLCGVAMPAEPLAQLGAVLTVRAEEEYTPTSGSCGDNLTWKYDASTKTLTISGTGEMYDYIFTPWCGLSFTKVIIEDGVTSIGKRAFDNSFDDFCELADVTLPNSITSIGENAFCRCFSISSITLPNKLVSIGDRAFEMSGLTSITIPDSVTSIGNSAFEYGDLVSVTIPNTVAHIGASAFSSTPWLREMQYFVRDNVLLDVAENIKGEFVIPDGITKIGDEAFNMCFSLTAVTIPDSVTEIGKSAFQSCSDLTAVELPDNVTVIERSTFQFCKKLNSITFPEGLTSIGSSAFELSDLAFVTIPDSVKSIGASAFSSTPWLREMQYFVRDNILLDVEETTEGEFVIPDGVTSIADEAFEDCEKVTSVMIPDTVTNIGNSAFRDCRSLVSITIPENVTNIDSSLFECCYALTDVTILGSVEGIGDHAFFSCESLTTVTIPEGVTSIGEYAFWLCDSLTSITIPKSVETISKCAFFQCESLMSITIENPYCYIYSSNSTICNAERPLGYYFTGTVYGYENSTADQYAGMRGYKFESIGKMPEALIGDVTGDDIINAGDAAMTLSAAAAYGATGSYGTMTDAQIALADIDDNSMVNASDAAYILQYAAMRGANGKDFDIRELVK